MSPEIDTNRISTPMQPMLIRKVKTFFSFLGNLNAQRAQLQLYTYKTLNRRTNDNYI